MRQRRPQRWNPPTASLLQGDAHHCYDSHMVVSEPGSGAPPSGMGSDEADRSRGTQLTATHHNQGIPTVYTPAEAALILRVTKSWLERQAAARKIPFTMLGHSYRFTPAHLTAIVRMHEQLPAAPDSRGDSRTRSRHLSAERHVGGQAPAPLRPRPRNGPRRAA
jgi:excisionase family DNA binding protein